MLRATQFLHKSGVMQTILALVLVVAHCCASEAVPGDYQGKLDGELEKLDERYDDIRKELDEEFIAISHERDQNCQEFSARVTVGGDASNQPGVVKRTYETANDAVADAYHDAVHYLTD